jgi:hypothetical protein
MKSTMPPTQNSAWQLASSSVLPAHQPSRRLYFFAEQLPSGARNVHHVYAPVQKHGVVLDGDAPWEAGGSVNGFCGSVIRLDNGRYRLYYTTVNSGSMRMAVAESDDGLRWHVPHYDRPALNAHWLGDQSALSAEQRLAEKARRTNDANFVYWNPRLQCYEQFSQWFLDAAPGRWVPEDNCPDFNRMIQRRVSAEGLCWSAPELVIQADEP